MAFTELIATPDFEHIRQETGVDTEDAIRLIWLMLQDEINRRERLSQTVGGTTGHNLLSATHPDTVPADPIQGDIIVALGSAPVDNGKYWLNGEPVFFPSINQDNGAEKYWFNGEPLLQGGFGAVSGSGTKWQRKAIGSASFVLTSDGTQPEWVAAAGGVRPLIGNVNATFTPVAGNNNDVAIAADSLILPIDPSAFGLGVVRLTGLQGGTNGRVVYLVNVGSAVGDFQLLSEDPNSAAANRFKVAIAPRQPGSGITLVYIGSLSRWMAF